MRLIRYRLAAKDNCGRAREGNGFFTPTLLQHMGLDPIPVLAKALTHREERGGVLASQVARPADPDAPSPESAEEAEVLQASIKAGSVAQIVVAVIAVLGLIYVLKLVLITTLTSLLLAFLLEPLASSLGRIGLPRWAGALLSVLLMVALDFLLLQSSR